MSIKNSVLVNYTENLGNNCWNSSDKKIKSAHLEIYGRQGKADWQRQEGLEVEQIDIPRLSILIEMRKRAKIPNAT